MEIPNRLSNIVASGAIAVSMTGCLPEGQLYDVAVPKIDEKGTAQCDFAVRPTVVTEGRVLGNRQFSFGSLYEGNIGRVVVIDMHDNNSLLDGSDGVNLRNQYGSPMTVSAGVLPSWESALPGVRAEIERARRGLPPAPEESYRNLCE